MSPANPQILTVNGGSSSIKFALFEVGDPLERILEGAVEGIGQPGATLRVKGSSEAADLDRPVQAPDHAAAVSALMDWVDERGGGEALTAAGHRVVHGGPLYSRPARITAEMVEELQRLSPFDNDAGTTAVIAVEEVRTGVEVLVVGTAPCRDRRAWS